MATTTDPHDPHDHDGNDLPDVSPGVAVVRCFEQLIAKSSSDIALTDNARSFKVRAYRRIVEDLLTHFPGDTLTSVSQVKGRPGYGKRSVDRIQEILLTGTLKELGGGGGGGGTAAEPRVLTADEIATNELLRLTGVGLAKATRIVAAGGTLAMLRHAHAKGDALALAPFKLTPHQLLGLRYYDDLQHRIPREVIDRFDSILQQGCASKSIPCQALICGSYRRGRADSGDIDVLLHRDDWTTDSLVGESLQAVLRQLEKSGYLVDHLTSVAKAKTKYMGFVRIPDHPWACRIDIRAVVRSQVVPAMAYFTGSKTENVRLRRIARKKGFKLNEYGLLDTDTNESVPLQTEADLYAALDEPFRAPDQRE
jgi:DNA polymerase/3'-5' exonuclease PolX